MLFFVLFFSNRLPAFLLLPPPVFLEFCVEMELFFAWLVPHDVWRQDSDDWRFAIDSMPWMASCVLGEAGGWLHGAERNTAVSDARKPQTPHMNHSRICWKGKMVPQKEIHSYRVG